MRWTIIITTTIIRIVTAPRTRTRKTRSNRRLRRAALARMRVARGVSLPKRCSCEVLRSTRHGDHRRGGHHASGFLTALLMKTLLKVMIALVAVAVLAVVFVRSAQSARA